MRMFRFVSEGNGLIRLSGGENGRALVVTVSRANEPT
jgi:hypothetical protein